MHDTHVWNSKDQSNLCHLEYISALQFYVTRSLKAAELGSDHVLAHTSTLLVEHTPTRTPLPASGLARAVRTRSLRSAASATTK